MSGASKPPHYTHAQSDISLESISVPVNDCCLYKGEANKEKARVSPDRTPSLHAVLHESLTQNKMYAVNNKTSLVLKETIKNNGGWGI